MSIKPSVLWSRPWWILAVLVLQLLSSCTEQSSQLQSESQHKDTPHYSLLRAGNRYAGSTGDAFYDSVQPVLAARCAVCHSCTNGPCQLNMTSFEALRRGLTSINPYSHGLKEMFSTRVSDNLPTAYWREKGFLTVLPELGQDPKDSIFFKSIQLGRQNGTIEAGGPLSLRLARQLAKVHDDASYTCPSNLEQYEVFTAKTQMGGMPWALPSVAEDEHGILENWVLAGAPGPSSTAKQVVSQPETTLVSQGDPKELVSAWEDFLNEDALESQLVSRYLYEHSFQANIHLEENPGEYYRMVRSRTAPPAAIDRIVTDSPMENPGVKRVYYRLEKIDRVIEGKTHVLWNLGRQSLDRFQDIFFSTPWQVKRLPDYSSRNPFEVFEAIPARSRAQFMIENSKMIYQSFARGPICMIQTASYVADEYYWLWFLKPESDPSVLDPKLGLADYKSFFSKDGNLGSGIPVVGDKYGEPKYRAAFEKTLRTLKPEGLGLDDIWYGEGQNPNAWLVYNRHQVSAEFTTPADRPITGLPRSVWLVSYANFERMYYNATVEYRYWGSAKHQNDSFSWQTYARTEAEDLYASLYYKQSMRDQLRDRYTTLKGKIYYRFFTDYAKGRPAKDRFETEDQLMRTVYQRMGRGVLVKEDRLNHWPYSYNDTNLPPQYRSLEDFEAGLRSLTARTAPFARFVPNVVHIRVDGQHLYSLLANRGYHADKMAATEAQSRAPERDQIMAVPGFAGFESHLFIDLNIKDASAFVRDLSQVKNQGDWNRFHATYGIARNSQKFWPFVDWMHGWMERNMPEEAGLLELRFYDKDEKPF